MGAQRIPDFDVLRPGFGGATVNVFKAGTTDLAALFFDIGLTQPAPNPQTLITHVVNEVSYGKWGRPVYTADAYELDIPGILQTGVTRPPLLSLVNEDGSRAKSTSVRGNVDRYLEAIFDTIVDVEFFGSLETDNAPSTNTTTLANAIGAAAAQGGGAVLIKAGTFPITALTLPVGVVLVGQGEDATTLQSTEAGNVITLSGNGAGLVDLTLDGINLVANSFGIWSEGIDLTRFDRVTIKRFATGMRFRGGRFNHWTNLNVENCLKGGEFWGDDIDGTLKEWSHNRWEGGRVTQCTTFGLYLNYEKTFNRHNTLVGVDFVDNSGTAVEVNGARYTRMEDCRWAGNVKNFHLQDDSDLSKKAENTVIGFTVSGGQIADGENEFAGRCQDVLFERMNLGTIAWDLNIPENNILLRDCTEDAGSTITGDATKLQRKRTTLDSEVVGVTTDGNAIVGWAYKLAPGEVVYAEAKVIGRRRNGTDDAVYHIAVAARRPGDTLAYDNQTANFAVGTIVTGQTSGAKARIVADTDGGTSGTLTLRDITGTFQDNEIITDTGGGSAQVNGALVAQAAVLLGTVTELRPPVETTAGWAATFGVSGQDLRILVTGAAGHIVEWTIAADLKVP